ncbi:hypothetical protein SLEP1_g33248 [Rubroshorea leprosula]|uniref:Uncharacterized protein n=1 Tax=Rubroshorea leprosula TaxID=152421 RepID=A0AAV5KG04_9ROSI|nr:hypothetical protein SLEP1_g33248 [Rubroshorea leprosula]
MMMATLATILAFRLSDSTRSPTSMLAQSRTRSVTRRQYSAVNHTALEMTCLYLSHFSRPYRRHQSVAMVVDSRNSQLRRMETSRRYDSVLRFDSFSNFDVGSIKDSVCDSPPIFSSQSYSSGDDMFVSQPLLETLSPPPIGGDGGGFSEFSTEENGNISTIVFW